MSKLHVVIVGHVCIDHNTSENANYSSWGSSVLYMTQVFQKQFHLYPIAISSYGPDLLPYLPQVSLLPEEPNQTKTLIYENDTMHGKRTQRCRNTEAAGAPTIDGKMAAVLAQADIVIVGTLLPNYSSAYLQQLLSHTQTDCLKVLCPQGYFRKLDAQGAVQPRDFNEALHILPLFDLTMYSEEDHPLAFEYAKRWKRTVRSEIIVTQSSKGATIVGTKHDIHIPTTPIAPDRIVDSVGCGDTFAAAVAYHYYMTKDLRQAVTAAHQIAAAKLLATPTK